MTNILSQFQQLFEYDSWANQKILAAIMSNSTPAVQLSQIMSHIAGAHQLWYQRITGGEYSSRMVWPALSLKDCKMSLLKSKELWLKYLSNLKLDDLSTEIAYTNSQGRSYKSSIYDILMQVVMHGNYHRAQIALLMRQADIPPLPTDYIFYVREE